MTVTVLGLALCIPDMVWTIINFLLFFFLLKKFLFKPILDFMEKRNSEIAEGLAQGEMAEKTLQRARNEAEEEIDASNIQARDILNDARIEALQNKDDKIFFALEQSAQIRKGIREKISREEADHHREISDCMTEYVTLLSNRLLHSDEALRNKNQEIIKDCVDTSGNDIS